MKVEKVQRESNIELLRIVLMFMIILHHIVTRGLKLRDLGTAEYEPTSSTVFQLLLNSFLIVAVNTYVFISGYFQIKFKVRSFFSIFFQALVYSVGLYALFVVTGLAPFDKTTFITTFFFFYKGWWFVPVFLVLYALSPILNKGLAALTKPQLIWILLIMLALCNIKYIPGNFISERGFGICNFIFIYILAYFCRYYVPVIRVPWLWYIVCCLITFAMVYVAYSKGKYEAAWTMYNYNSPFIILAAVFFFYTFRNLSFRSGVVNAVAGLVFGTYLIHEQHNVVFMLRDFVWDLSAKVQNEVVLYVALLGVALGVFIVGISIEKVRQLVCDPIVEAVFKIPLVKKISDVW
jgi:surface polysaccharide O-acyltransferase-like enzyme